MSHAETKRQRQEALEQLLMTSRDGWLPSELAKRLGVDRSTIHRDLDEISQRTAIVQDQNSKRYHIDMSHYMRNVRLTNAEALTIYIALRQFIRRTSHAPVFFSTAIQKIAQALRHSILTENLSASVAMLEAERQANPDQTQVWNALIESWYERVVVEVAYQGLKRPQPEVHFFEPYLFEPAMLSHGVYVIGWSHTRNELRTFKLDRIQRVTRTARFFERDESIQPDELLRHAWGVWYGQALTQVVLRFEASVAPRVRETIWHPSQETQEQPDGSLLWSVAIAGTLELVSWIRGWGPDVEVLEPADLRQQIADDLRRAAARYRSEND